MKVDFDPIEVADRNEEFQAFDHSCHSILWVYKHLNKQKSICRTKLMWNALQFYKLLTAATDIKKDKKRKEKKCISSIQFHKLGLGNVRA